jgi:hypothetical protein
MKYSVSDMVMADTKTVDVSEFFPGDEKVTVTVRHLPVQKRNEVIALMTVGQKFNANAEEVEIKDPSWFVKANKIQLLNGVVVDDSFPFEKWDEATIEAIDQRNPSFIELLLKEIQDHNRPLAQKKNED